jgi:UDP-N-acetylmuramate--alanine ligase
MYPSKLEHIHCGLPGFHNIENATAALALTLNVLNLPENEVTKALASFRGAKRRFEYVVKTENKIVIDDYAHHPQELNAIIGSVKELYPNKKLTAIFQPHLFTRTRDFADGFAESLSKPDETILMDIYPARELPIEGITSEWLLSKINSKNKILMMPDEIIEYVKANRPELLLILGAGDIDRLVPKIKEVYHGI